MMYFGSIHTEVKFWRIVTSFGLKDFVTISSHILNFYAVKCEMCISFVLDTWF